MNWIIGIGIYLLVGLIFCNTKGIKWQGKIIAYLFYPILIPLIETRLLEKIVSNKKLGERQRKAGLLLEGIIEKYIYFYAFK